MHSIQQKQLIQNIDKVLKSKTSRLSKKDIEILVVVREGLKNSETEKTLSTYLLILMKWFKVAAWGIKLSNEYRGINKGG